MAPPKKRRRVFSLEEARELVTMENRDFVNIMDSDSESDRDRDVESSDDDDSDSGPTRSDRGEEEGEEDFDDPAADFVQDSDSEYESDDDQQEGDQNEEDNSVWVELGDEDWNPTWYESYADDAKLLFDIRENADPVHYFYQYFPEHLFTEIAEQTNRYAEQCLATRRPLQQHSRFNKWSPTNASEMKAFTGLQIAMGLVTKSAKRFYWEENWLTGTPGFSEVMSSNRYILLDSFLHLSNNEDRIPHGQPGYDPLFKVRPVMDAVLPTYRASFSPGCNLSIDESLIPFKGRLNFRQYLPLKPKKWGVKFFVIADAPSGFCLDWIVYTGRDNDVPNDGDTLTTRVVKKLAGPFAGSARSVYMDSFYSSPDVFEYLRSQNIGACGTVRLNRRGMPIEMRAISARQRKGDPPSSFRKGQLMATTWHDTKRVTVLSTIHGNGTVEKEIRDRRSNTGRRIVQKPAAVDAYNKAMGGVDLFDQRMSYYRYPHKHMKWYQVIYHFIIEVALVNAFLSYQLATNDKKMTMRKFRLGVINGLCAGQRRHRQKGRPKILREANRADTEYERLNGRHFCAAIDNPDYRPDCIVCSRKRNRKQVSNWCENCKLPMCKYVCFKRYHTLRDYKIR